MGVKKKVPQILKIPRSHTLKNIIQDNYDSTFNYNDEEKNLEDGGNYCLSNETMEILINLSHLFLAINSSVNVIVYTFRGKKYCK